MRSLADAPQILRRVCPAFKGWKQQSKATSGAAANSRSDGALNKQVCCAALSTLALAAPIKHMVSHVHAAIARRCAERPCAWQQQISCKLRGSWSNGHGFLCRLTVRTGRVLSATAWLLLWCWCIPLQGDQSMAASSAATEQQAADSSGGNSSSAAAAAVPGAATAAVASTAAAVTGAAAAGAAGVDATVAEGAPDPTTQDPATAGAVVSITEPSDTPGNTAPAPAPQTAALAAASSSYAESEAAGSSSSCSSSRQQGKGEAAGVVISSNRHREEDYFGVCHTDVVKCIVITDGGKIFTAGWVCCVREEQGEKQGLSCSTFQTDKHLGF